MGNFLTIKKIDPMWYLFHDNHLGDREFFFTEVSIPTTEQRAKDRICL